MIEQRQLLALAYGISLWDSTQRSLEALRAVGHHVPYSTLATIAIELNDMVLRWPTAHDGGVETYGVMNTRIAAEAARYLAEHWKELDELLQESEKKPWT